MAQAFTSTEYLDGTTMITAIQQLVLLDRYWTSEAAATDGASPDRAGSLTPVVVQMERLLVEVELRARGVTAAALRRSDSLESDYRALVAEDGPFTERQRAKVVELVEARSGGDVVAFVSTASADAAARVEDERRALNGELDRLRASTTSDGDMSADEERALAELAIMASVAFGPEAGVIVEAVGHLIDWLTGG